jgi:outer membrane protein TolC
MKLIKIFHLKAVLFLVLVAAVSAVRAEEAPPAGPPKAETDDDAAKDSSGVTLLSLNDCLKRALASSDKLKAEKERVTVLEEQQKAAWWQPFSNFAITGKFTVLPTEGKCVDVSAGEIRACDGPTVASDSAWKGSWGPSMHAGLSGILPIPTSGKFWQGNRALDGARAAKQAMLLTFEQQIAFDVQRAYHAILGSREMKYTLTEGRKHLKKAMKKVEENLANQAGSDTEIDLVKLKVFDAKLDAMEQDVLQIERTALAGLRFLVGSDDKRPVDLADTPQAPIEAAVQSLDDYKKAAVDHRPEFEAFRLGIRAMENKIKYKKSALVPEAGFWFSYRFGYTPGVEVRSGNEGHDTTPFVLQDEYNYGGPIPGMALVARIPLDYGITIHEIREAEAELQALVADKKYAMQGILLEVENVYIKVTTLHEAVIALDKSKRLARGWLNAAAQNQAVGVGSSNDVKDALKEYFGIMADYHQKVSEYNIALAELDKAVGAEISIK